MATWVRTMAGRVPASLRGRVDAVRVAWRLSARAASPWTKLRAAATAAATAGSVPVRDAAKAAVWAAERLVNHVRTVGSGRVDVYAPRRQCLDHVLPVFDALEPDARGTLYTRREELPHGAGPNLTLVAAEPDLIDLRGLPAVFMEHGVGITYRDGDGNVVGQGSGSGIRPNVVLFLSPNDLASAANRLAHPAAAHEVVGVPRLDRFMLSRPLPHPRPLVVYSTHFDGRAAPEALSAHPEFREALRPEARSDRFDWAGHAHPRAWDLVSGDYERFGIRPVARFEEVLASADCYVADNTSTLYEFAATGRPVVVLNASFYRRDHRHGLRFWDLVPGVQVDVWGGVNDAVAAALAGAGEAERAAAVDVVVPVRDGSSARRAAAAIEQRL